MTAQTAVYIQIWALLATATIWLGLRVLNEYRRLQGWQRPVPATGPTEAPQPEPGIEEIRDLSMVPGAAQALVKPTAHVQRNIVEMHRHHGKLPYAVPFGWRLNTQGEPTLLCGHFTDDVYHMLITGQSRVGKDVLASQILLSLAMQHGPRQLQICVIDGKGLDFVGWEGKAHTWRLALEPEQIKPAMEALTAERQRRGSILREAQVSKWENHRGGNLPLLVVYVSELSLLEDAVGKSELTNWLNSELAAGAAFGIRYMIATQTAANFATRWRSQISLYIAGFQPSQSQDAPNTGLTTTEIRRPWAVPPSELPPPPAGAGVFTCIQGREAFTVRAGNLTDHDRAGWLARLPEAEPEPVPQSVPEGSLTTGSRTSTAGSILVLADTTAVEPEAEIIRKMAEEGASRNQIAARLGGNRSAALAKIREVLGEQSTAIAA